MIRIAVVDDEKIITDMEQKKIKNILDFFSEEYEIYIFTDGITLLNQFDNYKFDLIILDIDMPDITGMEIAKKLRGKDIDIEIIFVTNKDDFVYDAIKYSPFRFIRKLKFDSEIYEALENFIYKREKETIVKTFSTDYGKKMIQINKIIFIEVRSHKLTVYMNNNKNFIANGNLKDIENEIAEYGFIRIHQSYLVNFQYINIIKQKEIVLDNGERLPISRGKYENVKMQFVRFSREL